MRSIPVSGRLMRAPDRLCMRVFPSGWTGLLLPDAQKQCPASFYADGVSEVYFGFFLCVSTKSTFVLFFAIYSIIKNVYSIDSMIHSIFYGAFQDPSVLSFCVSASDLFCHLILFFRKKAKKRAINNMVCLCHFDKI